MTPPSMVQLVRDDDTLVVPNTVKASPALSVKSNWKEPLSIVFGLSKVIAVADQSLRPGKIAMDDGELNPDAKREWVAFGVNISMVPLPEFAIVH